MENYKTAINDVDLREIGNEAVWSLSTAKGGHGVDQLRDDNTETYWQSDGPQPHLINIQFHRKMKISKVCLYLDSKLDESYTPKKLSFRSGSTFHDLKEVYTMEIVEPKGWVSIPLKKLSDQMFGQEAIMIAVISMHQNGRDTHIRQVKVFTPRQSTLGFKGIPATTTVEMNVFSCVR